MAEYPYRGNQSGVYYAFVNRHGKQFRRSLNRRLREWNCVKKRKQPAGKIGRPRSMVPIGERWVTARVKPKAALAQRGLVIRRAALPAAVAAQLRTEAFARGENFSEYLGELVIALVKAGKTLT